jgi:hypothetical protein
MNGEPWVLWELCDHGEKLRHPYDGGKRCAGGREVRLETVREATRPADVAFFAYVAEYETLWREVPDE